MRLYIVQTLNDFEEFFPSETLEAFKTEFLRNNHQFLLTKFTQHNLNVEKLWSRQPIDIYSCYENKSFKIKL